MPNIMSRSSLRSGSPPTHERLKMKVPTLLTSINHDNDEPIIHDEPNPLP